MKGPTYEYTFEFDEPAADIVAPRELTIHYRVVDGCAAVMAPIDRAHPAEHPIADPFEVTENGMAVDDATYERVLGWIDAGHERELLEHAAQCNRENAEWAA